MVQTARLFLAGSSIYPALELLYRKKTHVSMAVAGGTSLCFINKVCNGPLKQKSLLPIGVCEVINEFNKGDVVSILDENRNEIARGIVNYGSDSCRKVIGCHSDNIMEILGFKNYDAIITRDNITLL